ncbi:unnamed protein product [Lactuca saligna]|uniref:Uncharacterized protein n=1 Tax=Lactuca saligna TaxID=75948 RepID=A0AA35VA36_LACSI|nr:unnamed protein product [Lactuca saligna]
MYVRGLIAAVRHRTSASITIAPPSFSFFTSDNRHHRSCPTVIRSRATQMPMEAVTTAMRALLLMPFDDDKAAACYLDDVCLHDVVADTIDQESHCHHREVVAAALYCRWPPLEWMCVLD